MSGNSADEPLNREDLSTIAYLKGDISFQEYESILENSKCENELKKGTIPMTDCVEIDSESGQSSPTKNYNYVYDINDKYSDLPSINLSLLKPFSNRKHSSASTSTCSGRSYSKKKSPKKITNLNLKNNDISEVDEEILTNDDTDTEKSGPDEVDIDNFDDTSNWNDFDIETLNFDKFIKDHQLKIVRPDEEVVQSVSKTSKTTKFGLTDQQISLNKRKLDDVDENELKAKRRVLIFKNVVKKI